MKSAALLLAFLAAASASRAQVFVATRLSDDGAVLTLVRANRAESEAPKLDDQDRFDQPAIAPGGEYAGWLAMYPDRGASYSQPLHVVVIDGANRIHRFSGEFGMVFGWCFDAAGRTVTLKYSFPHGATPVGFDVRRIRDGALVRRHTVPAMPADGSVDSWRWRAPAWAQCAWSSGRR